MALHHTEHIVIDTRLCEACGRCVESCRHHSLGMLSFLFHRHAKVRHADRCRGCLRCVTACEHGAIQALARGANRPPAPCAPPVRTPRLRDR